MGHRRARPRTPISNYSRGFGAFLGHRGLQEPSHPDALPDATACGPARPASGGARARQLGT